MLWLAPSAAYNQISADDLYEELDAFVANPSPESGSQLEKKSSIMEQQADTKEEFLALVIVYCNLGYYYQGFNSLPKQILRYEKAWSIYETKNLRNYDIFQNCLVPLSKLYTQQGDFLKAEEVLKQSYFYAEKQKDWNLLAQTSLSLSALYNTLGNFETAIKITESVLPKITGNNEIRQALNNNLATSFIGLKQYSIAKKVLQKIIRNKQGDLSNSYKNLAFIALQEQNIDLANNYFKEAKAALLASKNFNTRSFIQFSIEEAELKIANNKISQAQKTLDEALKLVLPNHTNKGLPEKEVLYPDRNLVRLFEIYAQTFKNTDSILQAYDLSFYAADLLMQNYTSQETKIVHQTNHKIRSEKCVRLLWNAYLKTNNRSYIEKAFVYAEQSKSPVLYDKIRANNSSFNNGSYPQKTLVAQREKLLDDLLRLQFKNSDKEAMNEVVVTIQKIDREINTLAAAKAPVIRDKTINFEVLQKKLKEEKASIKSYFLGKTDAYLFSIDAHNISMIKLNNIANLEADIRTFTGFFNDPSAINNHISNFTLGAHQTFNSLHVAPNSTAKNLVLIPDGLLHFLPFESLLTEATSSLSFAEMPFLVKDWGVAYCYNVYDYLLHTSEKENKEALLLGVFPIFENTPQALSYSEEESKSIESQFPMTALLKSEATKNNFLEISKSASIIHLSTHAGSGDFLVPAYIQFRDDKLYLPEIYSLDMTDKTIILSACETGVGKLQRGEGALSVARAFKYAGASKLLVTHWEVNDQSTAQVMGEFYKALKKNETVFEANTTAKLAYLHNPNISNLKKSPYFWNSFAYYGSLQAPNQNKNYFIWCLSLILSLVVIYGIWKVFKR